MNRDYLGNNKSPSTIKNYNKAFKKFDSWLETKQLTESKFLDLLSGFDNVQKYSALQEIINFLNGLVSPRVVKEYFGIIYKYLLIKEVPLDRDQKDLRLQFPRSSKARFEGLDETMIRRIMEYEENPVMRAFYSGGYGAGMRETELLLLKPSMIRFNEKPYRLILPKEITKFNIPRETFIPEIPGDRIKSLIWQNHIRDDQTIFGKYDPESTLIRFEKHFARIRNKVGYDTPNRTKNQQNDITLHSFRSFFTTIFMDNGLDWFGLAITGHTKYMDTYFRKSLTQRQLTFNGIINKINF